MEDVTKLKKNRMSINGNSYLLQGDKQSIKKYTKKTILGERMW